MAAVTVILVPLGVCQVADVHVALHELAQLVPITVVYLGLRRACHYQKAVPCTAHTTIVGSAEGAQLYPDYLPSRATAPPPAYCKYFPYLWAFEQLEQLGVSHYWPNHGRRLQKQLACRAEADGIDSASLGGSERTERTHISLHSPKVEHPQFVIL